jgi:iron complex transport system ATP-binding protein
MQSAFVTVENLTLRGGGRELLRDLDLCVHAGERWAVLGPNGAGKSTLLAALAGVRAPVRGVVRVGGSDVQHASVSALARARALMTDRWIDPFSASVLDTVLTARYRFGAGDAGARSTASQWLAALDVAALEKRDVRELSRGERQRVALATALMQDTPLVLLDEPTAHQDPRHQALVLAVLGSPAVASRALMASLHDMNAAVAFATHALLLNGDGAWHAGPAVEVLTAERLSEVFAARIRSIPTEHGEVFFMANGDRVVSAQIDAPL